MPAASEVAKSGAPGQVLVAAEGVSIAFRGKPAVENVAIAVHASEIVTLIGPNGAGKTTLARALLGLAPVLAGRITRKPGLRIGYVPQRFPIDRIIPLSVRRFMSLSEAVPRERAAACLAETGAERLIDAQMCELSGGEFQRVLGRGWPAIRNCWCWTSPHKPWTLPGPRSFMNSSQRSATSAAAASYSSRMICMWCLGPATASFVSTGMSAARAGRAPWRGTPNMCACSARKPPRASASTSTITTTRTRFPATLPAMGTLMVDVFSPGTASGRIRDRLRPQRL